MQNKLRKALALLVSVLMLCTLLSMLTYELSLFGIGTFLGSTASDRIGGFLMTVLWTVLPLPVLYPILLRIGKIGGETWKE